MSSVALILLLLTQSTYRANFNLDSWVLGWLCGGCVAPAAGGDSCCPRRPVPVTSSPPPLPQSIVLLISKYTFKYNRSTVWQWAADTWQEALFCFHVPIVRFCQPAATCHTCKRVTLHRLSHFRLSNESTGNPSFRADTLLHLPTSLTTLHHPSIISMINISIVQYSHYFPPQLLIAIGSTIQNLIHRTTHQSLK